MASSKQRPVSDELVYAHAHPMALKVPPESVVSTCYDAWLSRCGLYGPLCVINVLAVLTAILMRPLGGTLAETWHYSDGRAVEFSHPGYRWPTTVITGILTCHLVFLSLHRYNKVLLWQTFRSFDALFVAANFVVWNLSITLAYVATYRLGAAQTLEVSVFNVVVLVALPVIVGCDACEMRRFLKVIWYSVGALYFVYQRLRLDFFNDLFLEEGTCFTYFDCSMVRSLGLMASTNIAVFLFKAVYSTAVGYPFVFLRPMYNYGESHGTYDDLGRAWLHQDHLRHAFSPGHGLALPAENVVLGAQEDAGSAALGGGLQTPSAAEPQPLSAVAAAPEADPLASPRAPQPQALPVPVAMLQELPVKAEAPAISNLKVQGTTMPAPMLVGVEAACLARDQKGRACPGLEDELIETRAALARAQEELLRLKAKNDASASTQAAEGLSSPMLAPDMREEVGSTSPAHLDNPARSMKARLKSPDVPSDTPDGQV